MTSLKDLLYVILKNCNFNIYIQDLSGIFSNPLTDVNLENKSYSSPLNSFFKKNIKCTNCRQDSLSEALSSNQSFIKDCPCGMCEAVYPVIINGKTRCILYAESISKKTEENFNNLESFCGEVFDYNFAKEILNNCPPPDDILKVLEIISSYITLLFNNYSFAESKIEDSNTHWVVNNLKNHIEKEFHKDISLKQMAVLYGFNEKYLGRIFKSHMNMTFHEYLNAIRLENASEMLLNSEESVVSIAKKCGFNNVTYLNRLFLKRFEKTPLEYRNSKSNRFWDRHSYLL